MKYGSFQRIRALEKGVVYIRHLNQAHVLDAVTSLCISLKNKPAVVTHVTIIKISSQSITILHHFLSYSIFHLLQVNIPSE
jgi:hypothetical protein